MYTVSQQNLLNDFLFHKLVYVWSEFWTCQINDMLRDETVSLQTINIASFI